MLYILIYALAVAALNFGIAGSYANEAMLAAKNPWHWRRRIKAECDCAGASLLGLIHLIVAAGASLAIYFS